MPKLHVVELSDIIGDLPDVIPFTANREKFDRMDDLFLCALGFEDRCMTLPRLLGTAGYRSCYAAYFQYKTNQHDNDRNKAELRGYLASISPGTTQRSIEEDQSELGNRLRRLLEDVVALNQNGCPHITIDISAIANRLLVTTLKVLLEFDVHLHVLYAEAAVYHPTKEEYENEPTKWKDDANQGLEHGISEVFTSPEFAGYHLDPLPDVVILFPTFKADRSKTVVSNVDPSLLINPSDKVIWLLGVPHLPENKWRLEAVREINGLNPSVQQYNISTFDYKEALPVLETVYDKFSDTNKLTLSPLGSKMQALATALFCYLHPDVRVIFAIPNEYNASQYSNGCRATWQIDFGSVKSLSLLLDKIGTLTVED